MTSFLRASRQELPLVRNPVGLIREVLHEAERRVYDTQPPFPHPTPWIFLGEDIEGDYSTPEAMNVPRDSMRLMSNYPPDFVAAIQSQVELELGKSKLSIWSDFVGSRVPGFESRLCTVLTLVVLSIDACDLDTASGLLSWLDVVGTQAGHLLLRPSRSVVDVFDEV